MSKYYNTYKAVKPLAKIAGQKTVKGVKAAAKKAKESFKNFEIDQKYEKAKKSLHETLDKTEKNMKDTVAKTRKNVDTLKEYLLNK